MALGMRLERSLCFGSSINCEVLTWLFVWLVGGEARLALAYFFDCGVTSRSGSDLEPRGLYLLSIFSSTLEGYIYRVVHDGQNQKGF